MISLPSASTVLDSMLFKDSFGTPAMRAVFSDQRAMQHCMDVEVALASAQAKCGVIPYEAAQAIAARCKLDTLDWERMKLETEVVGYPILPLVHQLVAMCGDAGRYVHWGATTQDIMDSALVLQLREAIQLLEHDLHRVRRALQRLASEHRDTLMAGRTHLQQALPVTFGLKVSIWLGMLDRHQQRLRELKPRLFVGQFAGAAGTLASLGNKGLMVQEALMLELGLAVPITPWHVARDNLAEVVNWLGLLTGSLGKIAMDVILMASTEVAELAEPFVKGRGASSTMPQKRNPISSELMLASAKAVRQHAGLMLDAMVQDLERATGPWHAEWIAIPQSFMLSAGALHQAVFMLEGLEVDAKRMRQNLDLTQGLIVAEAVMMGLAPYLGRQQAHDLVYEACRACQTQGGMLFDHLYAQAIIRETLSEAQCLALTDPGQYLGCTAEMVDCALAYSRALDG
ncbi:MAG: adenylosuccinate lyase family protein [Betaproteobacteria bacterium]|nr:adenylosuccinate lyase family protein [Pseudomonadota bacterium]NBO02610.1 adenylosuccinate lyase family protein [Betaproteobacteria bacterium]NCW23964.1 adenylosuccinate lyase family protein [Betaproteobacteria bacterium]